MPRAFTAGLRAIGDRTRRSRPAGPLPPASGHVGIPSLSPFPRGFQSALNRLGNDAGALERDDPRCHGEN